MDASSRFRIVQVGPPDITVWADEPPILAELDPDLEAKVTPTEEAVIQTAGVADAILAWGAAPLTRRVIEQLTHCLIIARYGVGVDSVDLAAATEHGILVTNVPDYCVEEVAVHALLLLLACNKKLTRFHSALKQGRWDHSELYGIGRLQEQTLGLIGLGRIGRALARQAQAVGLKIIYFDPFIDPATLAMPEASPVELETLLRQSDYISLHLPLTPETRHLIGEPQLRAMKSSAFLINTARGPIVDEAALIRALAGGWIAGAALDVFEKEPPQPDNPLLEMDNVIITPHIADYSEASRAEVRRKAAMEVVRVLRGEWPVNLINQGVRAKARFQQRMGL